MKKTYPDDPIAIVPNRTRFYDVVEGVVNNAVYINTVYRMPAGGLLSTAGDLVLFMDALQRGKLVKPETLNEMTRAMKTNDGKETGYGDGIIIGLTPEMPGIFWHGGVQPGCTSAMAWWPERDLSVVVLTNEGNMGGAAIAAITADIFRVVEEE